MQQPDQSSPVPWLEGVRGSQVIPLISLDAPTIRVEAGPGTGKTFGLIRRVQRLLHPDGCGVEGNQVLIVAFNRVIAAALQKDMAACLEGSLHDGDPVIRTVHALCLQIIGGDIRLLLPHEREAMIYDVLQLHPDLQKEFVSHSKAEQALKDHEAKHVINMPLWQAVYDWLIRHNARLLSDLPAMLVDRLQGGDFPARRYRHVIVDEFQDLTPGEQALFTMLTADNGNFLALGDSRQSIYAFRGNDRQGLNKLEELLLPKGNAITDLPMAECHRCPAEIVEAANQLMGLYDSRPMVPASKVRANTHLVVWNSPRKEAEGMAGAIVKNLEAFPDEAHLVMVTRRQFGYMLREEIAKVNAAVRVDLSFSESLLEAWPVREAFIFFCLMTDPDAPSWRAWLAYRDSTTGKDYKAANRNAGAYLNLFTCSSDMISIDEIRRLALEPRAQRRGGGGQILWDRACRYLSLRERLPLDPDDPEGFVNSVFEPDVWISLDNADPAVAKQDMELLLDKAMALLKESKEESRDFRSGKQDPLAQVAKRLRYHIGTREPFVVGEGIDLQVATLWGAKGVTADHVYVLGLCKETIPGKRREEYPGTELDFYEEQRRLFYVSVTRSKRTLVLSRAQRMQRTNAIRMGLGVVPGESPTVTLEMCPFLRDIINFLPKAVPGDKWRGVL